MNLIHYIFQDWGGNRKSILARVLLVQFRFLQKLLASGPFWRVLAIVPWIIYKIYAEFFLHIELSPKTKVGGGVVFPHPFSIVINVNSVIGRRCVIRHGVTIGNKGEGSSDSNSCPCLHDNVDVGCNAVLLGAIDVGEGAIVGAGSVLVCSVESGARYAGVPAKNISAK